MKPKRGWVVVAFGLAIVPWMVGCENGMWGPKQEPLKPREQLGRTTDIPVPAGFEMDEAASEDKSTGGWRYVRHTYLGKPDPQRVRVFYREEMPLAKWNLLSDEMRQGTYHLHFENELENADITISQVKKTWSTKTKIVIEVSPKGKSKAIKKAPEK